MSSPNSHANSPSDEEEKAELLLIQKKKEEREERARREAEQRKAEEEAEAAAEARLAEIRRKKEEKKKREAEEKKKKEELEKRKAEEAKAAEAAKKAAENAKKENERKKAEEESKAAEAAKRAAEENRKKIEMERRMETAALVRAQIEKKKKEQQLNSVSNRFISSLQLLSSIIAGQRNLDGMVGQKRKRVAVVVPSGDPEGGDLNPGDDDDYVELDTDDDEDPEVPPTSPPKQSRCSRCILKAFKCELVGPGSASCKGCRKAKVRCSLVPDDYPRRSKRVKMESPVASTSSRTIEDLRTNIRDLNTRINLQEEMLRYLILRVRKLEEEKKEEEEEEEESEEDRVKRTGDRKGKGRKE
ncbi:hypothetical protein DFJ43DRAFT_1158229 [Lentinula guzmanii]|uniref:Zn(2)-C6 fungal-type domain-containing protein n=1 Tax=Lentinula guzmanii TaxID=2804957 RepID=A0AA38JDT8_9AGAR|nr:hypothetical protein DFJ43DRAFT_1158229 [Lentinula guzmanii]